MFKVSNKDTKTTSVVPVPLLLTLYIFPPCSSVPSVIFEYVIAGWSSRYRMFYRVS